MAIALTKGKILTGTIPTIDNNEAAPFTVPAGVTIPSNINLVGIPRVTDDKGDKDLLTRLAALMTAAKTANSWKPEMNSEFQVVMREIGIVLANTSVEGLRSCANGTAAAPTENNRLGKLLGDILKM